MEVEMKAWRLVECAEIASTSYYRGRTKQRRREQRKYMYDREKLAEALEGRKYHAGAISRSFETRILSRTPSAEIEMMIIIKT